ncbi:MAG: hypothetical protein K5877_10990 [Lachnospiraceae bacterium]|nr:hypothetical protein [Lachnospiraceae bacterium]
MKDYDHIIEHEHYQSKKRPHMPLIKRAAQFAPFAALVGYDDAVDEAGHIYDERITLEEDKLNEINSAFMNMKKGSRILITYYRTFGVMEKGNYVTETRIFDHVDIMDERLVFEDGDPIRMADVTDVIKE